MANIATTMWLGHDDPIIVNTKRLSNAIVLRLGEYPAEIQIVVQDRDQVQKLIALLKDCADKLPRRPPVDPAAVMDPTPWAVMKGVNG